MRLVSATEAARLGHADDSTIAQWLRNGMLQCYPDWKYGCGCIDFVNLDDVLLAKAAASIKTFDARFEADVRFNEVAHRLNGLDPEIGWPDNEWRPSPNRLVPGRPIVAASEAPGREVA